MKEMLAKRSGLIVLAVIAAGISALVGWLFASGQFETGFASGVRENPVVEVEQREPASSKKSVAAVVTEAADTLKGLQNQFGTALPPDHTPKFDVARIEADGAAVIAGHGAPGASVELLRDGKVHDRAEADASGAFVFVPKPLPPGRYDLSIRATDRDGKVTVSKSPVAVTLDDKSVIALAAPKAPAVVPQRSAADIGMRLRVQGVETERGGGIFVSGVSAPGATVRLYLNDSYIATGTASPDGHVRFSIRSGVIPGEYRVRLDQVNASGGVLSRAEMPFSTPSTVAKQKSPGPSGSLVTAQGLERAPAASTEAPSGHALATESSRSTADVLPSSPGEPVGQTAMLQGESPSKAVNVPSRQLPVIREASSAPPIAIGSPERDDAIIVPSINTRVIVRGDNLWRISQATYGHGERYTAIFGANRNQIRDPNLIYPDQIIVLPATP